MIMNHVWNQNKVLFTSFMWERSPYCLVFDGAEMNKHNITVGSSCAKDGTWTWAHLPNNIWKRIIGFQSQVSISHSFISVTNREQVLPPLYSSPSFHHPSCCSLNFAYFFMDCLLSNFTRDNQQRPPWGQLCTFLPRGASSVAHFSQIPPEKASVVAASVQLYSFLSAVFTQHPTQQYSYCLHLCVPDTT